MSAYRDLERRFRRLGVIGDAIGLLQWDHATTMPEGGAEARAEQLATLRVLGHELLTDPQLADLLAAADEEDGAWRADPWARANLREMHRVHGHATAVPPELIEAEAKASAACEMAWRRARPGDDYAGLVPALSEVLHLVREIAAAKGAALGLDPYDALLDAYEPGTRAARLDAIFAELAGFLGDALPRVLERQRQRPPALKPEGPFPADKQRALGERLMRAVGFDFSRGRLDVSHHPFCGGASDDVRITTRYDESDFTSAIMGVLHETGHAMYELGLPKAWRYQPVGVARGMAVHESQSLLIEMQACRSMEFLRFAAPLMRDDLGGAGPAWEPDNLYRLYTTVEPGLIRVDADEVTYPAHIILRFRLERALIAGDLALADLPGAWRDAMDELLGIVPPNDRLGCLQDIHWPSGEFAYFPTYTLGALAAAQLFAAARGDRPEILPAIAGGDFAPLMAWLGEHVHARASLLAADELIREATGSALDPAHFEAHIEARYLG